VDRRANNRSGFSFIREMNRQTQTVESDKRVKAPVMDRLLITLFFCAETFSRSLLLAIIPLELFRHLGSTQRVTLFYAVVAIFGLGNSILVPTLLKRLGVRQIIAVAGVLTTLAAVLMVTESPAGTALGLVVRVFASACIEISMLAYIMDRIPRHRLGAFEPIRIFFQGGCIAVARWFGFQPHEHVGAATPYIVSAIGGLVMLGLALAALPTQQLDGKAIAAARHPITAVRRFSCSLGCAWHGFWRSSEVRSGSCFTSTHQFFPSPAGGLRRPPLRRFRSAPQPCSSSHSGDDLCG